MSLGGTYRPRAWVMSLCGFPEVSCDVISWTETRDTRMPQDILRYRLVVMPGRRRIDPTHGDGALQLTFQNPKEVTFGYMML